MAKNQARLDAGNQNLNSRTGLKPKAPLGARELMKARQHPRSGGVKLRKFKSSLRG